MRLVDVYEDSLSIKRNKKKREKRKLKQFLQGLQRRPGYARRIRGLEQTVLLLLETHFPESTYREDGFRRPWRGTGRRLRKFFYRESNKMGYRYLSNVLPGGGGGVDE